ncbi:SDR family NAD(P)-dependent oxidoreductase [Desulfatiferula olefinivorans]
MKTLCSKTVVITGAGGGIGRALALDLANEGCALAISDINAETLDETRRRVADRGAKVHSTVLDVSDRLRMEAYPEEVVDALGGVDIVINNAGVAAVSSVEDHSIDDYEWLMGINFWGVLYGSKFFIPYLLRSPEALIVNISSVFGMVPMPHLSSYNAAKFAVRGFSEALSHELYHTPIRVMTVYPGGVKTDFAKRARFGSTPQKKTHQEFNTLFEKFSMSTPESTARAIVRGIRKNKRRVLIGPDARSGDLLVRLFPVGHGMIIRWISSRV